jgi:multidrug efflux pump subunit AcrA (membrane-fusion protein)
MKPILCLLLLTLPASAAGDPAKLANTVILDATAVKNLGIETAEAEETAFEETVFALGRIAVLPGKSAIVSSRIPGRIHSLLARPHVPVNQGDELLWIESRQPGDPPPVIMIEAPLSGLISEVHVAPGQPVTADTDLLEIVDLDTVEAAAAVPEHLAGKLSPGQKARLRVGAAGDTVYEANLVHLGAAVDPVTGTLEAAFHVPNPEGRLRPGMRAEFSIITSQREGVMTIPRSALQGDATNRFVFVKDYDLPDAFVKTPIATGASNDQSIEVLSGLLPGDEVVTKGGYSLAFAGKGSVSLKEALDAAHGHPHNEDGTEMTKEQQAAKAGGSAGGQDHEHGPFDAPLTKLFAATTALLLGLLLVGQFYNRRGAENAEKK